MGLEFGFPSKFFNFSFRGNSHLSLGGSFTISELLNGLRVTCAALKGLEGRHGTPNGLYEPQDGSFRLKIRDIEGFRGGFCLRCRGSSIISTRIGQGGGNVIGRTRRLRLRALGDKKGTGKGFEFEASSSEGDGLSIDASAGTGQATGSGCGGVSSGGGHIIGGVSVGVGAAWLAGEGLGLISRQPSVKVIVNHIKAANGVVKGVKAANEVLEGLKTHPTDVLLFVGNENGIVVVLKAAKFVVKSVKVSKGVMAVIKAYSEKFGGRWGSFGGRGAAGGPLGERFQVLSVMVKRMKAPAAALKIVKITMGVGKTLGECEISELLNWSTLRKGYKFSKSALTVFEVVTSFRGGMISMVGKGLMGAKGAVEGVGVMMKALWLSKEVYVVILKGLAMSKGAWEAFLAISEKRKLAEVPSVGEGLLSDLSEGTAVCTPLLLFSSSSRTYRGVPLRSVRFSDKQGCSCRSDALLALSSALVASVGEFPSKYLGDEESVWSIFSLSFPI